MQVTVDLDIKQLSDLIENLNIDDKLSILEKLESNTFEFRMNKIRNSIPKNDISEKDIINEVKSVRKR